MVKEIEKKIVKVVVLGDIGRSPRMQYHSLSLASSGLNVNIIGYLESTPLPELLENENIIITKLKPFKIDKGPKLLQYVVKTMWQSISLFLSLLVSGKCDYLLCQNPPAIPTLPICRLYCLISRAKLVIDWHNYAYTIMGLTMPSEHPLLKIAAKIEKYFGQSSDHNLSVTYAMKNDLLQYWNIKATVLYDRPPKIFHPLTLREKHNWFYKMSFDYPEFAAGKDKLNLPLDDCLIERTIFTQSVGDDIKLRADRPGLLFSSTSWTPDEDFSILFEALQEYEALVPTKKLPKLICVITGKGPMKAYYSEQIASRKWRHVKVVMPWLEASDYPTMVASADLGVCLHTSSSGLDLPMKVVDMFGAGLPVCAYDFQCIDELVENGVNGHVFKDANELSKQIMEWFQGFPNNIKQNKVREKMCNELVKFQESRWEENWNLRVKKYFES